MKFLVFLVFCLLLASCSTVHNNKTSYTQAERLKWHEKAKAGDAEAQFQMGNAWCCGHSGFFSTKEASYWWCQASQQGHSAAKAKLVQLKQNCQRYKSGN